MADPNPTERAVHWRHRFRLTSVLSQLLPPPPQLWSLTCLPNSLTQRMPKSLFNLMSLRCALSSFMDCEDYKVTRTWPTGPPDTTREGSFAGPRYSPNQIQLCMGSREESFAGPPGPRRQVTTRCVDSLSRKAPRSLAIFAQRFTEPNLHDEGNACTIWLLVTIKWQTTTRRGSSIVCHLLVSSSC